MHSLGSSLTAKSMGTNSGVIDISTKSCPRSSNLQWIIKGGWGAGGLHAPIVIHAQHKLQLRSIQSNFRRTHHRSIKRRHLGAAAFSAAIEEAASGGEEVLSGPQSALRNPKFWYMVALFFILSFINTILDSLGSSLVITAVGSGGTAVIPFLTVYAVWPCAIIFLVIYSFATQQLSRSKLFNFIILGFLAFFTSFGLLYPSHEALHFSGFANAAISTLPSGFAGAVGMVRNWLFTIFYCSAELWGDVVLSLLFWGLANETTTLSEAPVLYPLFGVGANVGQTISGKSLSLLTGRLGGQLSQSQQIQLLMAIVVLAGSSALLLHSLIVRRFPAIRSNEQDGVLREIHSRRAAESASSPAQKEVSRMDEEQQVRQHGVKAGKPKLTLGEAFRYLTQSPQIRCLAVMAMSQGLSTNLIEIAWKSHLHMLHPSPSAYAAFMGEVAMWTGIITGSLMFISPILFRKFGWKGVAKATPRFLAWTGVPFFGACICYSLLCPGEATAVAALRILVIVGAILQLARKVFGKGAKFSMFKPAEEMVYIGLDEESRTKGKAAIDVVGAQTGKSGGSVLQQVLLVACAGSLTRSLPVMGVAYWGILLAWLSSVERLSQFHACAYRPALSQNEQGRMTGKFKNPMQ